MKSKFSQVPFYRTKVSSKLKGFRVVYKETDLFVLAEGDFSKDVLEVVKRLRFDIESYILKKPEFLESLVPLPEDDSAPLVVKRMLEAGKIADVGPMAAVAGTIAEEVGRFLLKEGLSKQVVVENGGDIYLHLDKDARVCLFAGDSPFSGKVAILVKKELMPCGVCTSSATVGHSLSFGSADAVTVIHRDTAVADALATAFCNVLKRPEDFKKVVNRAEKLKGLYGVVGVVKDRLLAWGKEIKLEPL